MISKFNSKYKILQDIAASVGTYALNTTIVKGIVILASHFNDMLGTASSVANYCNCNCNYYTPNTNVCSCNYTIGCVCNCDYCTCNCNYCTCDCAYCTCDCNHCWCFCNYCTDDWQPGT